jgi:hypothetical protein
MMRQLLNDLPIIGQRVAAARRPGIDYSISSFQCQVGAVRHQSAFAEEGLGYAGLCGVAIFWYQVDEQALAIPAANV